MYEFDDKLSRSVAKDRVIYTRYADDLTFSAPRTGHLNGVDNIVRKLVSQQKSPRLTINDDKTVVVTKKFRRVVTGLVLSDNGEVSIGREKKRLIRSGIHHGLRGDLNPMEIDKLLGNMAYIKAVEPEFYFRLLAHYGQDCEDRLRRVGRLSV
jgi:hypothetical protein